MSDEDVKQRLITMADEDQAMREAALKQRAAWDHEMDVRHAEQLKQIVEEYGWPTISQVGSQASSCAWLIAQHADHDRDFQRHCLERMKAVPKDEVSPQNIAYLEDRVLRGEGKPQLYGTQFEGRGEDLKPQPITDEANVEARRKAMGLNSLAEYRQQMLDMYR